MRSELLAAESVQQTLLPHPTSVDGVHIRTFSCLASEMGGDWFGYYHAKKSNRLFFFVGDVTGHGVPSAIISGVACGVIYGCERLLDEMDSSSSLSTEQHLLQIAKATNQVIYKTGHQADRLMTMVFGCLEVESGILTIINAGHPHPFVVSPLNGDVKNVISRGSRLGSSPQLKFDCKNYQLTPGDSVFVYTDGLLENGAESGTVFSQLALRKLLLASLESDDINAAVLNHCNELWGEKAIMPDDDVSLLTITWEGKCEAGDTWGIAPAQGF